METIPWYLNRLRHLGVPEARVDACAEEADVLEYEYGEVTALDYLDRALYDTCMAKIKLWAWKPKVLVA